VLDVALTVARALERCDIGYFLGGSLASSYQGEPRATNDIDFVVALGESDAKRFADALGPEFDVDIQDAALQGRSWNVIHLPSVTKIDLIMRGREPFDESEFARRKPAEVRPGETLNMKTPEDTVLRKLLWYRATGEVSDRHWRDVVGVLRHSGDIIDADYLALWAATLDLEDWLEQVWRESRLP
jgi:hypothetical protein